MGYNIIALLSDLGTKDYFMGAIKGTILSINPDTKIVDITHEIPKHDIRAAAFTLAHAAEAFPRDTIFIVVVDPSVGTRRKCISVRTKNGQVFIVPDNGVLTLVVERFGMEEAREITNRSLMRPEISSTFHGRDIMAPVAAYLSLGIELGKVGPELKTIRRLKVSKPKLGNAGVNGHVLSIDDFGNIITNIDAAMVSRFAGLGEVLKFRIAGKRLMVGFMRTFGDVKAGGALCFIGSAGLLEIARNARNLAAELGVKPGDEVEIRRCVKKRET